MRSTDRPRRARERDDRDGTDCERGRVSGPSGAAAKLRMPGSTLDSKIRHWASGRSGSRACDEFRGDQMRDGRRRASDMEPPNPLVDRAITNRGALVLAQVFEPGLDDEAFDVTPVLSRILVDGPPDGAVAAANRLQVADGFHKGIRLKGIDAVFDLDADRSLVRGRDDVEVRLGPVCRRCEIEHRDLA